MEKAAPSRVPRAVPAVMIPLFFALTAYLSFAAQRHAELFRQLEIKQLPVPMEAALAGAALARSPAGLALWTLAALSSAGLVLLGRFDERLGYLTIFACLGIAGALVIYGLALLWPTARMMRGFGL